MGRGGRSTLALAGGGGDDPFDNNTAAPRDGRLNQQMCPDCGAMLAFRQLSTHRGKKRCVAQQKRNQLDRDYPATLTQRAHSHSALAMERTDGGISRASSRALPRRSARGLRFPLPPQRRSRASSNGLRPRQQRQHRPHPSQSSPSHLRRLRPTTTTRLLAESPSFSTTRNLCPPAPRASWRRST
jgi:hypothetical protein